MQVEQIDREAGADFMGSIPAFYGQEQPMRDGLHDTSLIVQALARHRHQARAEQAAELAKYKALAETLAGALGEAITWNSHDDEGVPAVWLDQADEALLQYKETSDETSN